ncbi:MAG: ATP-binding protein [Leptospiraceae bacterium]|nr:ATP-binding protein [Leptospiraceae bacterium]
MTFSLELKNFAMIQRLDIVEGDLNFFVGEQGTGKSLVLQLIKLLKDKNHIRKTLEQYGFTWRNAEQNLNLYYGEGMSKIWKKETEIKFNKEVITEKYIQPKKGEEYQKSEETVFYVPAQRVMCLEDGWPKYFTSYTSSTPYVMRYFSETLRQLLEEILSASSSVNLFPISNRLAVPTRKPIEENIYNSNSLTIESQGSKKNVRMKVQVDSNEDSFIPFMTWSAGQKEFFPLLLALYWLCPPSKVARKEKITTVIIEEPEMGLHPSAIHAVFVQILELLSRGYKVYVSTHSANFLEYLWAVKHIRQAKKSETKEKAFAKLTRLKRGQPKSKEIFATIEKDFKVYYFHKENSVVQVKDISELDVEKEDDSISEWGSLLLLSKQVSEIVSELAE